MWWIYKTDWCSSSIGERWTQSPCVCVCEGVAVMSPPGGPCLTVESVLAIPKCSGNEKKWGEEGPLKMRVLEHRLPWASAPASPRAQAGTLCGLGPSCPGSRVLVESSPDTSIQSCSWQSITSSTMRHDAPWSGHFHPHFTDDKAEAQRASGQLAKVRCQAGGR